jgi:hypothetical protein
VFQTLMQNYMKEFIGMEHMYPAARAYNREVHEHHKADALGVAGVALCLNTHHSLLWYRGGFNLDIKCDYIRNNITEVFNNWIKDHKNRLVCELADKIRVMIMELFLGDRLERGSPEIYYHLS